MDSLLAYEALGFRDFFTVVFGFVSDLASVSPLDSLTAFFPGAGRARTGLGFPSGAAAVPTSGATRAAVTAGSAFSSRALGAGLGVSFFTFFAAKASLAAGVGSAAGWSPLAMISPLYTQHLMP